MSVTLQPNTNHGNELIKCTLQPDSHPWTPFMRTLACLRLKVWQVFKFSSFQVFKFSSYSSYSWSIFSGLFMNRWYLTFIFSLKPTTTVTHKHALIIIKTLIQEATRLACQSSTRASNKRKHVTHTLTNVYTYKLTIEHIKHMPITVS